MPTIVSALELALTNTLGLRGVDSLDDFFGPAVGARYLRDKTIRMAAHFDLSPAFLILDPLLGSLGIVEVTLPPTPKDSDALVRRHIDTATYARHLLLRDPSAREVKALTVELVLLTADETEDDKRKFEQISISIRHALRDTDSLAHIGVNVLAYGGTADQFNGRTRRAFPWLLKATRDWLESPDSKPPKVDGPKSDALNDRTDTPILARDRRRLRKLTLVNYRLPGTRTIVLSDARVHLVHGPNGSGKSSLVEALELVSRGKIERLAQAQETAYDGVIKNRDSTGAATIALEWSNGNGQRNTDPVRTVTAAGLDKPINETVDASSFRLDQPLMDKLIGKSAYERMRDFLRAFFPEATSSLEAYGEASRQRGSYLPALRELSNTLRSARKAVADRQDWRREASQTTAPITDFPDLLNRWLERTVILDLIQRERAVRATLRDAQADRWLPHGNDFRMTRWIAELGAGTETAALEKSEGEVRAEATKLEREVAAFAPAPTPSRAVLDLRVNTTEVALLNAVGRWIFDPDVVEKFGSFGDKLGRVINADDAGTYGTLIIGNDQWTEGLVKQFDVLIEACKSIETDKEPAPWPGKSPSSDYDKAADAHRAMLAAGKKLSEQFIQKLRPKPGRSGEYDGSLIAAVNELMAFFTPARWGYGDIDLPEPKPKDGNVGLNIELGAHEHPVRAELHLNTAELNLFTVALFVLCAGRVVKPLNLLMFDDPLQNMDELTSTALARGLTKIVRLWDSLGRTEELLVLFHGQDDLERFRSEIAAATYQLPWLSPTPTEDTEAVAAQNVPRSVMEVQSIKDLLAIRES
jgi:energy-coupling factor transporter ATP-binding protein EcfA2